MSNNWFDDNMMRLQDEYEIFLQIKKKTRPWFEALKIIFIYLIFGSLWIAVSDKVLELLVSNHQIFMEIQHYKGWFYVLVTGFIFYIIIKRKLKLFENSIITILNGYEELSKTQEELMAMYEEIDQQNNELVNQSKALLMSEQRYELAVEGASDGIWDWDLNAKTYFFSIRYKHIFGYQINEIDNTLEAWKGLLHPDDCDRAYQSVLQYLEGQKGIYECNYRLRSKTGEYRWILSRGKGVWDDDGKPIRIAGSHTDITEQIQLQESLRIEKELSENIILDAPMCIVVFDKDAKIIQFNPHAERVTGYLKEEMIGRKGMEILLPNMTKDAVHQMFNEILLGRNLNGYELNMKCKNDQFVTILWNNDLLHDSKGNIQGVVSIGVDISERIRMERQMNLLAFYDTLTGLPNRTIFEKEGKEYISRAMQQGINKMAVIFLDVDDFKLINDTMGHAIGDSYIQYVAELLSDLIQFPDKTARLGGDEFAILLADVEDEVSIIKRVQQLLEYIRKPWIIDNKSFFVTMSIGIAIYPDHACDFSTLMQNADTALFHMKENGKNGFSFYQHMMYEKSLSYIQMRNQLTDAIEKEEFVLYYQPQIDLKSGKISGVEALIRWIHPKKGLISPMEFIPFAEKTGQIEEVDEWVLKKACRQKRIWEEAGYPPIKMAVNLSSRMVMKKGIVNKIQDIVNDTCINIGELEIEVTETTIMVELVRAKEVLLSMKRLGISIALDDFGTGYSSLTYLQKLPFDILKIDREFLKNVISEDDELYIYKAIIGLAHNMGLKIVSEGVETKEQKAFLINNNCDIGQGYYFGRPLTSSQIDILFKENISCFI